MKEDQRLLTGRGGPKWEKTSQVIWKDSVMDGSAKLENHGKKRKTEQIMVGAANELEPFLCLF